MVSYSELRRIVVAVDPATTFDEKADDTGIVVMARGPHIESACKLVELTGRCPGHGYVLADLTCHLPPHEWAEKAVAAFDRFEADKIVAEVNNGGDMVGETIHAVRSGIPYKAVNASRGKRKRAEPVATVWEQGRIHIVGSLPELEDELTAWTPDSTWSPNRLDAMVWAATELGLIGGQGDAFLRVWRGEIAARKKEEPEQESKEMKTYRRMVANGPRFGHVPVARDSRCEHRWRGDTCVFCHSQRASLPS